MDNPPKILVVDDEPIGRETLADLLLVQGYNLAVAGSGAETLAKVPEFAPDVILLDVMMPDMDGFEVCRRLRADPHLAEVPIIMVTALDDRDSRLQGIEAGADDFISKPFDRVELQMRVKTIIRLNRYRRLLTERYKFGWAVDQANEGYLMLDRGDKILYANPRARLFLGLSASEPASEQEPLSETFLSLANSQYHCEPQEMWLTWPEPPPTVTENVLRYLVRPETPMANALWLQVDLMEMESGSSERYMVRLYDVTASVVKQTLMWTFQTQISHKLKTPIHQVTGFLEILEKEYTTLSETQVQSYLSIARTSALQLQNELLDVFQYMEASEIVELDQNRCALAEVPAVITEIKAGLELESINLSYEDIEEPENTYVSLPRRGMELILWELLENAKKFHPEQSPAIDIKISNHPNGIQIQVSDNGQVLSPEQLAKIWLPYYQAEKYFTGQMPGMGLGLSMVATLVWQVGGDCRIYNRKEWPGVVVELVLPLKENDNG